MGTKVKGLIRGIKNISSQIFEEEKEQELQIGQPTDVKHVAHIGGDGPAVESPSWMKGFDTSKDSQSGPLEKTRAKGEAPQLKCVSEDLTRRKVRKDDSCHRSTRSVETSGELPLLPRTTKNRRRSMDNNNMASETKDSSSSQSRQPRRHHRGPRRSQDQNTGDESKLDIPKKSSRRIRKPKEESLGDGATRSSTKSATDDSELGSDDQ